MRRIINLLLSLCIVLGLCSCSQNASAPTWQEQYDLGVKYLSEGNYEEAIIAFTAAIEIDPMLAIAYSGRGQAYMLSGETEENRASALADFETALGLDETLVESWLGIADVYVRQGEVEKAIEVLRQVPDILGDNVQIITMLEELESQISVDNANPNLTLDGSGRLMRVSVTIPGLPHEFYMVDDNKIDAHFQVAFSDGKETFFIGTFEKDGAAGMISVQDGEHTYTTVGPVVYDSETDDIIWDFTNHTAEITRDGDTIIWNLELPEWSCSVEDIRYIGYDFLYKTAANDVEGLTATYSVSNGETTYYNDDCVEALGYILNGEETRYYATVVG